MELTQKQKLSLRLEQVLSEAGLHEIRVYVTPEKAIEFWIVKTESVEGLQKGDIISKDTR